MASADFVRDRVFVEVVVQGVLVVFAHMAGVLAEKEVCRQVLLCKKPPADIFSTKAHGYAWCLAVRDCLLEARSRFKVLWQDSAVNILLVASLMEMC